MPIALFCSGFIPQRSFKTVHAGLPHIPHPLNDTVREKQKLSLSAKSRKRPSSQQQSSGSKYFKPSTLNTEFLQLTDRLNELMQFCDPKLITEHCSNLMASDIHNIRVFPTEYVKKLQKYSHTPSLLRIMSSFWTWSDQSFLRMLLQSSEEATSLLDEYRSQTDLSQQLAAYPLPPPSACMMPSDSSTHTVLAVKFAQEYYQCLLKHVFEVQSKLTKKFDITPHSLQLLTAKDSTTILFWLIPKSVMALITTKVLEYRSILYDEGILEVSIFPGTRITTRPLPLSGPLVFLSPTILPGQKVCSYVILYMYMYKIMNIYAIQLNYINT